jgi:hypothetical protein
VYRLCYGDSGATVPTSSEAIHVKCLLPIMPESFETLRF